MKIKNIHTGEEFHYKTREDGDLFLEKSENPADWYFIQTLYCDGSGWNGKESGYLVTDENGEILYKDFSDSQRTNNVCEYLAMEKACQIAFTNAEIFSDSQLVVFQIIGDWKINEPKFIPIIERCRLLIKEKNISIGWVDRRKNIAGKKIEQIQSYQQRNPMSFDKMKERLIQNNERMKKKQFEWQ